MTAVSTADRFLVMHALRIKGLASTEALAEITGLSEGPVDEIATNLTNEELARHRQGRMSGYSLTTEGKTRHSELLRDDIDHPDVRSALSTAYDDFLALNGRFKQVCTDWQTKPAGGEPVPNDHSDESYDKGVVDELAAVHADVVPVLDTLATTLPRFGRYPERLVSALGRIRSGEQEAFAKPMSNSYHDIWMELHQDLLTSGERERQAHDEG